MRRNSRNTSALDALYLSKILSSTIIVFIFSFGVTTLILYHTSLLYRCLLLSLPSCSVACNKIHRENHPADPDPAPRPTSPPQLLPVDVYFRGDKQAGPFQILEQSEQLQFLFNKYPRLRSQLLDIHAATLEPTSAKSKIPASLLKDLPSNGGGWNPEKGIASGKEALRKARTVAGEDGEAIREYSELVLHIMDKSNSKANG